MKILLTHNRYQIPGGEDRVYENEAELLRKNGHQVDSFLRDNDEIQGFFRKIEVASNASYSDKSRSSFAAKLDQFRPDVVHVHNFFPLITPSIYEACAERNVPVVQSLHNFRTLCANSLFFRDGKTCETCLTKGPLAGVLRRCYRKSFLGSYAVFRMIRDHQKKGTWRKQVHQFIALSEFSRKKFIEGGFPPERISVKPNFVGAPPETTAQQQDKTKFLFLGRLSEEKGIRTLLQAWEENLGGELRIAGTGPLQNLVRAADRQGRVTYLGKVHHSQIVEELQKTDVLILPSECYENFPMSIVEAYSFGIPVIASEIGSVAEIVDHEKTGLHFRAGSVSGLRSAIRQLHEDPALRKRLGDGAQQLFLDEYTPERNYEKLMAIYQKAVGALQ